MIDSQWEPAIVYSLQSERTHDDYIHIVHPYQSIISITFYTSTCHRANSWAKLKKTNPTISISPLSLVCCFLFDSPDKSHQIVKKGLEYTRIANTPNTNTVTQLRSTNTNTYATDEPYRTACVQATATASSLDVLCLLQWVRI